MAKKQDNKTDDRSAAQIKAEKQENFKRVCPPRVNKAIKAIGLIGLCASDNYIYSDAEANAVNLALQTAVDDVKARFGGEHKAKGGFQLPK